MSDLGSAVHADDPEKARLVPFTRKELEDGAPTDRICKITPPCHKSQEMSAAYFQGVLELRCRKCQRLVATFKIAEE